VAAPAGGALRAGCGRPRLQRKYKLTGRKSVVGRAVAVAHHRAGQMAGGVRRVLRGKVRLWFAACALVLLLCALVWPKRAPLARAQAQPPAQQPPAVAPPTPPPPTAAPPTPAHTDEEVEHVETNLVNVLFNAVHKARH